jgi:hypothetical protein
METYIIEVWEAMQVVETIRCCNAEAVIIALDKNELKGKKIVISRLECIVDWS